MTARYSIESDDRPLTGSLGHHAPNFLTLLDLKRAKLQELAKNGWRNITTDMHFYY